MRKVRLVPPAEMESRVQSGFQDLQDLRDHPERMGTRERLVNRVRKEGKEIRGNMVLRVRVVFRVQSELRVLLAVMVSRAPGVSRECSDRREMKDPEDSLDFRDRSACRDYQDPRARRERPVTSVPWVRRVLPDREALRGPVELMELKALLVVSVLWEEMEKRVRRARLATRDLLESLVLGVLKVKLGIRERQDHPELPDPLEAEDHPEMMVQKETRDPLVSLEIRVHLVSLELVESMAFLEIKEMMEKLVSLVLPVHLVKPAPRDPLGREVPLVELELKESKEKKVPREIQVLKDLQVKPGPLALRDPLGRLALMV